LDLNFKGALAALSRALPDYLFYAAALLLGGLLVLLEFGLALFAMRLARIVASLAIVILTAIILLGGWLTILVWQRFFLYRRLASMLYLFSGAEPSKAKDAVRRFFPACSNWTRWKRRLRKALVGLGRENEPAVVPLPGAGGRLAGLVFSPAVFVLAFVRCGEPAVAIREGLALYWRQEGRIQGQARRWLGFSLAGFTLLFLCLALANAFIFYSVGVPVVIGITLAFVIAWVVHQAFVAPLALAGVSAALLSETKGRDPDPDLCARIAPMLIP